jgi:hypothetical protein
VKHYELEVELMNRLLYVFIKHLLYTVALVDTKDRIEQDMLEMEVDNFKYFDNFGYDFVVFADNFD